MGTLRREVGFLGSLGQERIASVVWPEGFLAGLGAGFAAILFGSTNVSDRVAVAGDMLPVVAVLLGIVFTAFTLLVTLWSAEYVKLISSVEGGVMNFLRPFMIGIGVNAMALACMVAYRAVAVDVNSGVEGSLFVASAFFFSFALADVVAIGRNMMMHARMRAEQLQVLEGGEGRVAPIDKRAGDSRK